MSNYKYIVFIALLGSLVIDGNTAKGTTYTIEVGTDNEDTKSQTHGQYLDEFIKIDDQWYFKKRTFSFETILSFPWYAAPSIIFS